MIDGRFGRLTDAPATLLLAGGRLVDPSSGADDVRDIAVLDGTLVAPDAMPPDAERVDARGWVIAPGFVDLHVHLREPGDGAAETVASGTRAAARGGFTTICAMPNTDPPLDSPEAVARVVERASDAACRVRVIGAATAARAGVTLVDLDAMAAAGVAGLSDDGASLATAELARDAMRRLAALGLPLIEHAEETAIARGGVMRAGRVATLLGLSAWPPDAEVAVVERDIAVAAETGARLHLTHLSTAEAVEAVRGAKARGVPVTADVTPHHLAMTERWVAGSRCFAWQPSEAIALDPSLAYDGSCRVNPPLPSRDDALALLAGLRDGTIDAIATDHAPHPPERKLVPFGEAAPGIIGLETALSVGLEVVAAGQLDLPTLVAALSVRPATIIGESSGLVRGSPADLVAFDPEPRWTVEASAMASASANTPLLGMELRGVVRLTVANGRLTYRS